jgi:hypothetical protein
MPRGATVPVFRPTTSTPLEGDEDGPVPKVLLWAMKDHRRGGHRRGADPPDVNVVGEGDAALYVIDAVAARATVGRLVGSSPDGCTYCLVASLETGRCPELFPDGTGRKMLAAASDFVLCAVYDGGSGVSNVSDVERFSDVGDVPDEYLPPHPFIAFTEVL